jgi:hypothetical protein
MAVKDGDVIESLLTTPVLEVSQGLDEIYTTEDARKRRVLENSDAAAWITNHPAYKAFYSRAKARAARDGRGAALPLAQQIDVLMKVHEGRVLSSQAWRSEDLGHVYARGCAKAMALTLFRDRHRTADDMLAKVREYERTFQRYAEAAKRLNEVANLFREEETALSSLSTSSVIKIHKPPHVRAPILPAPLEPVIQFWKDRVRLDARPNARARFFVERFVSGVGHRLASPPAAVADLVGLIEPDTLISDDTVDRWIKAAPRARPRGPTVQPRKAKKVSANVAADVG